MPAPPPESEPATVSTCLSVVLIAELCSLDVKSQPNIYPLQRKSVQRSAEDQRSQAAAECISDGHETQQQNGKEEVGKRALSVGIPERHDMSPSAESYDSNCDDQHAGAAPTAQRPVLQRSETHVKQRKDRKQHERYCIENSDKK